MRQVMRLKWAHTQHRNPLQGSVPMTAAAIVVSSSSGRLLSGPQNSTNTLGPRPKEDEPASHAPSTTFFSIGHTTTMSRIHIRPMKPHRHRTYRIYSCPTDFRVFNSGVQLTVL